MDFADHFPRQESLADSAALVEGLLRVSQIVRLRFNDWLGQFDLNDGRYALLAALAGAENGGCSQAELAECLGQSESNVSTLVERMQRDGLVTRIRSESDRRKREVRLTPVGRENLDVVDAARSAWNGRLLKGFPDGQCSQLHVLLQQLGTSLKSSFETRSTATMNRLMQSEEPVSASFNQFVDPSDDPQSPQFALRQMLLAMSTSTGVESNDEKDAA